MAMSKEDIIKEIEAMTVVELNDLVEALKEKFGVTAAPVAAAGAAAGGEAAPEKSDFNIILSSAGQNKIAVIKEVKAILGLGLKEAKAFVDEPGKALKEGVEQAEADEIKEKLEAAGATVELK